MKIRVEQIVLEEHVLIYSKYIKDTETLDEFGADYEYDFDSFISNLDEIQQTILRLYGEVGLIKVIRHYADGAVDVFRFDPIEYEEGSTVLEKIRKLQHKGVAPVKSFANVETVSNKPVSKIPSDDIYLLQGWIDALPENDDLNVLKMVGNTSSDNSPEVVDRSVSLLTTMNVQLNSKEVNVYSFDLDGITKHLVQTKNSLFLTSEQEGGVILYPGNEFQESQRLLFEKFMTIKKVYKLKTSVILEANINNDDYYLLFNVNAGKFESKKRILKK